MVAQSSRDARFLLVDPLRTKVCLLELYRHTVSRRKGETANAMT